MSSEISVIICPESLTGKHFLLITLYANTNFQNEKNQTNLPDHHFFIYTKIFLFEAQQCASCPNILSFIVI